MSRIELDLGALADIRRLDDGPRPTLLFIRHSSHPPDTVWVALSDPHGLAAWAPFVPDRALEEPGTGTRITLRHTVDGSEWLARAAADWHLCLIVADRLLDGRPVGRIVGQQAKEFGGEDLHETYARALGVHAPTGGRS